MSNQFASFGLSPDLVLATASLDWLLPTDVQDEAIPLILGGADVLIAAETGAGKTGAFCLPALQIACEILKGQAQTDLPDEKVADFPAFQLSPTDRDEIFNLADKGLAAQSRHARDWGGCRASLGVSSGRFAFEVSIEDAGLCRLGFSTRKATRALGTDNLSFGYGGTGKKSHNGVFSDFGEIFQLGDVVAALVDLEEGEISYSKNGQFLGSAFKIPQELRGELFYPAIALKNCQVRVNFAESKFPLPSGFAMIEAATEKQRGREKEEAAPIPTPDVSSGPLVLIIEPTRELALQVDGELRKFTAFLKSPRLRFFTFTGGCDQREANKAIEAGLHVVVGTPGKLSEFVKSGKLKLGNIRLFILDEADQLMEIGSRAEILEFFNETPKRSRPSATQVIICSATLHSQEIRQLSEQITVAPQWVDLKGRDSIPNTVDHAVVIINPETDKSWTKGTAGVLTDGIHRVSSGDPREFLSEGLKVLKPQVLLEIVDQFCMDQCLIFARTQLDCDNLERLFVERGGGNFFKGRKESGKENPLSCVVLHGGRKPEEREKNLQAFKDGDVRFLICTDVAARGLDIKNLPFVINLTLPDNPVQYIHRVGRVGRADAVGLAISIVATCQEKQWFHQCNRPDRGRGCVKTALTSSGGCCIWFDELAALRAIEEKLGNAKVPHFDRHSLLKGARYVIEQAAAGRAAPPDARQQFEIDRELRVLAPTVQKLRRLELSCQANYLRLKVEGKWREAINKKKNRRKQ